MLNRAILQHLMSRQVGEKIAQCNTAFTEFRLSLIFPCTMNICKNKNTNNFNTAYITLDIFLRTLEVLI